MAQQLINIGTSVNDRSGDPLRLAFDKVNQNFTDIYGILQTGSLTELAQDYVAEMFINGDHDGVTVVYDDSANKLNIIVESNLDGGAASTVFENTQTIDGGGA